MRPVDASCDVDVETYDADEAAVMTVLVLGPLSSLRQLAQPITDEEKSKEGGLIIY